MTYDWRNTMHCQEGTPEYYQEIDLRFWRAAWFGHGRGEEPFSRLIEYPRVRGKQVLEIGCGAGSISAQLAKHGAHLAAIDLTERAVALTRRRFELFGLSGNIQQMDARHLNFPDHTFDYIWSWGVIHHSADAEEIIAEIHRVLKPGGEARVMVYHRNSIEFRVGFTLIRGLLFGGLLHRTPQEIADKYSDGLIAKFYTASEFRALFKRHFRQVQTEIFGQKVEVWQIPGGRLKTALVNLTPDALAWWLTRKFGSFLFLSAIK